MKPAFWVGIVITTVLAAGCSTSSDPQRNAASIEPIAAYTLLAPTNASPSQLVARALMPANAPCPMVEAVGAAGSTDIQMTERRPGPLAAPAFSTVLACSASLPKGLTSATISGQTIPATLPKTIKKVGIIADTGCEVDPPTVQDCKSATAWPLAANASKVAAAKPDVILDPGDYYYREAACPPDAEAKCGGSPAPMKGMPFYETSDGWLADVINPMSAMFPVAPLAMLRGNHEDCQRAGNGFFLYLDPRPGTEKTCEPISAPGSTDPKATSTGLIPAEPQITPTWSFDLPLGASRNLRVAMLDNAYGTDKELTDWNIKQRQSYVQAAALTTPTAGRESWLMGHRPIFALMSSTELPADDKQATTWTSDGQMVSSYGLLGNYSMLLAAHLHFAQAIQIPGQPASLVIGNGGAYLDPPTGYDPPKVGPLANADGSRMDPKLAPYPPASATWTKVEFGYAIATPGTDSGAWAIDHFAHTGNQMGACSLAAAQIRCK